MRRHPVRLAALFLLAAAAASAQEAGHQAGLSIEPAEIVAGMFYDGALVHVRAPVPAGARVAIVARGEAGPLQLRLTSHKPCAAGGAQDTCATQHPTKPVRGG